MTQQQTICLRLQLFCPDWQLELEIINHPKGGRVVLDGYNWLLECKFNRSWPLLPTVLNWQQDEQQLLFQGKCFGCHFKLQRQQHQLEIILELFSCCQIIAQSALDDYQSCNNYSEVASGRRVNFARLIIPNWRFGKQPVAVNYYLAEGNFNFGQRFFFASPEGQLLFGDDTTLFWRQSQQGLCQLPPLTAETDGAALRIDKLQSTLTNQQGQRLNFYPLHCGNRHNYLFPNSRGTRIYGDCDIDLLHSPTIERCCGFINTGLQLIPAGANLTAAAADR